MVNSERKIVLIVHNVRSAHNVGSILRTSDAFGVENVYLTGYSPYPKSKDDTRLPHIAERTHKQISKTALGAENTVKWKHVSDVHKLISRLKIDGFSVVAIEQAANSKPLHQFKSSNDVVLIVGSEVGGIDPDILALADEVVEIPMSGSKESLNVAIAAGIALNHFRYTI